VKESEWGLASGETAGDSPYGCDEAPSAIEHHDTEAATGPDRGGAGARSAGQLRGAAGNPCGALLATGKEA
jgi:hypothetical protein